MTSPPRPGVIRPALESDLVAVRRCAEAAYAGYVARIGRKPAPMVADFGAALAAGGLFVAEDEESGGIAGYIVFYPRGDYVHLENVAVDPTRQGRGLGRALIEFAERRGRDLGLGRIELYTNAKMTENLALYPRLGYREFARRVEDGFDRVYFGKDFD